MTSLHLRCGASPALIRLAGRLLDLRVGTAKTAETMELLSFTAEERAYLIRRRGRRDSAPRRRRVRVGTIRA